MPMPHGDHGLAFAMSEVGVLRRALLLAMKSECPRQPGDPEPVDYWLLDRAIGEADAERHRLRAFHLAELAHQRAALPGSGTTYLSSLEHAVAGYRYTPTADDLAALRGLADQPCGAREQDRRERLLAHCTQLAERALDRRLAEKARERQESPAPLDLLVPVQLTFVADDSATGCADPPSDASPDTSTSAGPDGSPKTNSAGTQAL
ncbi:hypothetical protein [Streptodolium elevatio]|uniref:Uncharacterized protein n=1 Tax=Streptodolium elevatio TaxID=3157996 RepID=A0ABV3DBN2_9ACTN